MEIYRMRILLAQIDPKVGDTEGNLRMMEAAMRHAEQRAADLVVFPEMASCGYPPKDMLLRDSFIRRCESVVERLATRARGVAAIVGTVSRNPGSGPPLFNSAATIGPDGQVCWYHKQLLPTYDIFDESRYFAPGGELCVVDLCGRRIGVTICEDMWGGGLGVDPALVGGHSYGGSDPVAQAVEAGADMVVNISASPFSVGKQAVRESLMRAHSKTHGVPFVYVNQVGANDDLVFDGASAVVMPNKLIRAEPFSEHLLMVEVGTDRETTAHPYPSDIGSVRQALVLGVRDYFRKSAFFKGVVVGLSGGIDSAVTAAIAVEALGADKVHGVSMPSRHSSGHSEDDAKALAESLGIDYRTIPIKSPVAAMEAALAASLEGLGEDVTEENIQARMRGDILMALSNKFGWLVLTTGNKSELAVGYCTLYGDMCGGLAVISDVPKTMVFDLARHINEWVRREVIPDNTITKPPSAELRPGQVDQDTLPPYPLLDAILEAYVEDSRPADEIATATGEPGWVAKVVGMVDRNEYKRKQAAPGLRVTSRSFGTGWRMPIVAEYGG
ncbi:MAG: NAD+ synthase [Acidimicrobiia bacterium]